MNLPDLLELTDYSKLLEFPDVLNLLELPDPSYLPNLYHLLKLSGFPVLQNITTALKGIASGACCTEKSFDASGGVLLKVFLFISNPVTEKLFWKTLPSLQDFPFLFLFSILVSFLIEKKESCTVLTRVATTCVCTTLDLLHHVAV